MSPDIQWPKAGTGLRVETAEHAGIPALVAAGMGDVVLIVGTLDVDVPQGAECLVEWTTERGLHKRPGVLLSSSPPPEPRWRIRATGPARTDQRRRYTRADLRIPISVDTGDVVYKSETLDLSEGGLRCIVKTKNPLPNTVFISVELEGERFKVPCRIARKRKVDTGQELSIAFTMVPAAAEDRLRRQVFSAQVRHRTLGVA